MTGRLRDPRWCRILIVWLALWLLPGSVRFVAAEETEAATRQYAVAVGFQNRKLYDFAIDEWKTFLSKFPEDPRVDRAQHYLGTCSLQGQKYRDAVTAFQTVVTKYPKFELLDQSLLNLGIAWYGIAGESKQAADFQQAERALAQMLKQFPRSEHVPRALYYQGECLFQQDKPAEAATAYADLVARFPQHEMAADATYALGTAQESLKQTAQARATFAKFASQFPTHPLLTEVEMRQAELLFSDGDFDRAGTLFARVASNREFEQADQAMMRQARCLYETGKIDAAGTLYWNVPSRFGATKLSAAAVLAGAKCFYLTEQYTKARSGLDRIAKLNVPEAAEANQWLARAYLKEKQPNQALTILDEALARFRTGPERAELELARIDTLYELASRKSQTVELYADFAKRYPKHELAGQAQYMSALTALDVENPAAAKLHGDGFLKQFSGHALTPDVQFIASEARLLLGEYDDAARLYRQFLDGSATHANAPQATVRLGLALHMSGDNSAAAEWLEPRVAKLPTTELRSESLSLIGRSYAAQKKFEAAASSLLKAYLEDANRPDGDETLLSLAEAYRQLGKTADANEQLLKIIQRYPNSERLDEAYFRLGEAAYGANQFEPALNQYARVIQQWPDGTFAPHAQYGLGWTQFNLGRFQEAHDAMTRLLDKYASSEIAPKGLYVRAMASYQLGDFPAVAADVDAFLKSKPGPNEANDARYVQGLALAGQQKFEQAATVYADILRSARGYAAADKVAYELGWSYVELGKVDEAVVAFRRLATDWPESPLAGESLFRVGESYYDSSRFPDAAQAYQEAASRAKAPEIVEKSLHKLGWSYLKSDQFAKASDAFAQQLSKFPQSELAGDAQFLVGESRFKQEQWEAALTAYEQVAASRSATYLALSLHRAGECEAALKHWPASQKYHERVLKDFPGFDLKAEARYGLGWALQNQNQIDAAIAQYEKVTEETQTETAAKARFMIGECCFAGKKHTEATKHFLKAAFAYGHKEWSAMSLFEAGRCFEVLRNVDQARDCYRQLVEKYPAHAKVRDARQRLTELGK